MVGLVTDTLELAEKLMALKGHGFSHAISASEPTWL
jgi:hypothetical protein